MQKSRRYLADFARTAVFLTPQPLLLERVGWDLLSLSHEALGNQPPTGIPRNIRRGAASRPPNLFLINGIGFTRSGNADWCAAGGPTVQTAGQKQRRNRLHAVDDTRPPKRNFRTPSSAVAATTTRSIAACTCGPATRRRRSVKLLAARHRRARLYRR